MSKSSAKSRQASPDGDALPPHGGAVHYFVLGHSFCRAEGKDSKCSMQLAISTGRPLSGRRQQFIDRPIKLLSAGPNNPAAQPTHC